MLDTSGLEHRAELAFPVSGLRGDEPKEPTCHRTRRLLALLPGSDGEKRCTEEVGENGLADTQRDTRPLHVLGADLAWRFHHDNLPDGVFEIERSASAKCVPDISESPDDLLIDFAQFLLAAGDWVIHASLPNYR